MRFAVMSFLLALLVAYVAAVAPLKAVVISYPSDTPWSVLDEAKDAIRAAVRYSSSSDLSAALAMDAHNSVRLPLSGVQRQPLLARDELGPTL